LIKNSKKTGRRWGEKRGGAKKKKRGRKSPMKGRKTKENRTNVTCRKKRRSPEGPSKFGKRRKKKRRGKKL